MQVKQASAQRRIAAGSERGCGCGWARSMEARSGMMVPATAPQYLVNYAASRWFLPAEAVSACST